MRTTEVQRGEVKVIQPVSGEVGTHTQAVRCPGPKLTSWPHWLSICHKLQYPVQTPSPECWIVEFQGIHGFGLSISPLTQGLHSWQCSIQCGLDWSRVPDNTVRHPPSSFRPDVPTPSSHPTSSLPLGPQALNPNKHEAKCLSLCPFQLSDFGGE